MAISSVLLQTTPTAISPSSVIISGQPKDVAITVIFFCNLNTVDPNDGSAGRQFLDIYVVANGDGASPINQIAKQLPVDAGDTFTFNVERLVLSPGDRVLASSTNSNQVSATISYVAI
jgi:hypothetical protein